MSELLGTLMKQYGTDKSTTNHAYSTIYSKYFEEIRNDVKTVLEIGVWKGASLKAWQDFFPNAIIYGMDTFESTYMSPHSTYSFITPENCQSLETDRIKIIVASQEVRDDLKKVGNRIKEPIDILIDDGGHWMHQQQITFGAMFPYIKSGGWFVIEDLYTSYIGNQNHFGSTPSDTQCFSFQMSIDDPKTLNVLKNFVSTSKIESKFILPEEAKYLEDNIKSCIIEKGKESEIGFIQKNK